VLLRAAPLALAALALAACGGKSATTTQAQSQLPPGCSAEQAHAIVTQFLANPSFAPPSFFTGYRSQETDRVFQAKDAAAALAHVNARLKLGERDRLLQLQVYPVDVNHVHVVFSLTRTAPDFPARGIHFRIASGDGTLDCAHGKVAQWSQNGP
jgi:hypothetical protein